MVEGRWRPPLQLIKWRVEQEDVNRRKRGEGFARLVTTSVHTSTVSVCVCVFVRQKTCCLYFSSVL